MVGEMNYTFNKCYTQFSGSDIYVQGPFDKRLPITQFHEMQVSIDLLTLGVLDSDKLPFKISFVSLFSSYK